MSKYEPFWCSKFQWMSLWRSDKFLLTLSVILQNLSHVDSILAQYRIIQNIIMYASIVTMVTECHQYPSSHYSGSNNKVRAKSIDLSEHVSIGQRLFVSIPWYLFCLLLILNPSSWRIFFLALVQSVLIERVATPEVSADWSIAQKSSSSSSISINNGGYYDIFWVTLDPSVATLSINTLCFGLALGLAVWLFLVADLFAPSLILLIDWLIVW